MASNQAINYPETAPVYHEICKYLMNCPLDEDFTKIPSVVYQNLLREFWCTAIATHPNPPTDDFEDTCPENCILCGLEDSVHICCLVLLGPDYTHDESFGSSPTILSNSNFLKDPFKVTPIELMAFMGPKTSGALPQKRKKPKSKKTPTETKLKPHRSLKGHMGTKTQRDFHSIEVPVPDRKQGKTSFEVEPDIEPLQLQTFVDVQAFLLYDDEMVKESDDDVFEAGEDMEEDT
ncbi:hypothetical protein Tco_0196011 [Tanacetum coccineum]